MAMEEVERLTDIRPTLRQHKEDYEADIRDAGNPDFIRGAASSRNLPLAKQ